MVLVKTLKATSLRGYLQLFNIAMNSGLCCCSVICGVRKEAAQSLLLPGARLVLVLGCILSERLWAEEKDAPGAASPVVVQKAEKERVVEKDSNTKAVPTSDVSRVQAWKDAERVAEMGEGRVSAVGSGGSMQPVFGNATMIVISKIAYEDLMPGMTVAYLNKKGRQVVHQLLEKKAKGWRVQGLNNEEADNELVTRDNLLGVVYASIAAEEP